MIDTVLISPQKFRNVIELELGLRGVNANASSATCPLCRTGLIRFDESNYYTTCCRVSGSLAELSRKLKQYNQYEADKIQAKSLANPDDMAIIKAQDNRRLELLKLWKAARTIGPASNLNAVQHQFRLGSLEYTNLRTWHWYNLDEQIRILLPVDIKLWCDKAATADKKALAKFKRDAPIFVMRGHSFPGQLSSIALLQYSNLGVSNIELVTLVDGSEPGYFGHPNILCSGSPLVLTRDINMYMRTLFWQTNQCDADNQLVLGLDQDGLFSERKTMFIKREVITWGADFTGPQLKHCYDIGAKLTTFATSEGVLTKRGMASLDAYSLFKSLQRRAVSCQSYLGEIVRQKTPDAAVEALAQSGILFADIESMASAIPQEVVNKLQSVHQDDCPCVQAFIKQGTLEQRSNGWQLVKPRSTEQICTHAFRIDRLITSPKPRVVVEVYYDDAWVQLEVCHREFLANAFKTVQEAALTKGLGFFSFDRSYAKYSADWCVRLNPIQPMPTVKHSIGVDLTRRELCTNGLLITQCPVSIREINASDFAGGKCLSMADNVMPDMETVTAVCNHQPTFIVLSGIAVQLLRYINGVQPYVFGCGYRMAPFVKSIFEMLDLTGDGIWPCNLSHLDRPTVKLHMKAINEDSNSGYWMTMMPMLSYWISGMRSVCELGHQVVKPLPLREKQMHRLMARLLYESMRTNEKSGPIACEVVSVDAAWKLIIDALNTIHNRAYAAKYEILKPIHTIDSVAYWLKTAVNCGMATVARRSTNKQGADILIRNEQVTFRRELLSKVITKHQFMPWPLSDVTTRLVCGSGFINFEEGRGDVKLTLCDRRVGLSAYTEQLDRAAKLGRKSS